MKKLNKRKFLKFPTLLVGAFVCGTNKLLAASSDKLLKIKNNSLSRFRTWRVRTGLILIETNSNSCSLKSDKDPDQIKLCEFTFEGTESEIIRKILRIYIVNLGIATKNLEKTWDKYQPVFEALDKIDSCDV